MCLRVCACVCEGLPPNPGGLPICPGPSVGGICTHPVPKPARGVPSLCPFVSADRSRERHA